ncbi:MULTISPECIES: GlxA family transcriptional regulator [Rhodobacterales]|nr:MULTISPECIES: GlxA family transcriptional regulator [Phaeobacter]MDF1772949.1 GlxA family transcriptional regulator [Pseudophaeobacter sp. bin_em_oilr2.035]MDE4061101.1 GlxA family transcriptional regulator [Phaeobacter gallaeciensis]MDE4124106.1 GlxA family transcriptional regulator [Phaeobacter gallaeciensis]MDE4128576.1 GlxA family transcriptional regulator [Phaeobacter gallaeciensis]MDE4141634.1 GlxA family transcriptional regulator [Phaeobacter gallaeciensis]
MQSWVKDRAAPQQVDVLLFDDFSGHCLANTVEPMRAANTLAGRQIYDWRFLTLEGGTAVSSAGMEVNAHGRLAEYGGDMLIAMPSYHYRPLATDKALRGLRAAARRYAVMAGFDAGAWLLASAGLLDGHRATIHWEELQGFTEAFPSVDAQRLRYVRDGDRVTCSGALAAFELMLDLIAERHGQALRLELAALFMSPEATGGQVIPLARSRSLVRAIDLMQANLEMPLPIGEVARRVGRSQKDLEARMKAELGAPPQAVYRRLRLIQARKLVLETTLSVAEISLRCGYEDPSAMTRAFRQEFGSTPRQMRRG